MDADSVSLEAQTAIDRLRKDSLSLPVIQSDNGSSFIAMESRTVLRETNLTQKLISPHTPEQNGMEVKGRGLSLNCFHHLSGTVRNSTLTKVSG